jgi:cytosine deaminase
LSVGPTGEFAGGAEHGTQRFWQSTGLIPMRGYGAPMADLWVRDARVAGAAAPVDIVIREGRIDSIGDAPLDWSAPTLDGFGLLALPGFVDGHAHLDKTMWGLPWRPHSATPGLAGLISNERSGRRELPAVADRAGTLLDAYIANGTTLMRTHVDVDLDNGLTAIEGVIEAAAQRADAIDVQVVAFPQSGMLVAPGTVELLDAAVAAGANLIGGIDPAGFDGDPVEHLDTIFAIAERHGCGIDLHLHDRGSLGRWELDLLIERTRALGMDGNVTVSHAFCLCDGDPAIAGLVERLGEHRISLATVAPGEVTPLPLDLLDQYGVDLCLGQDGIRDLWSPWGDADMLSRAGLMAWRSGYRRDSDIERCVTVATSRGAAAIGVADHGLAPGHRGDLVLIDAATAAEAAVATPARRAVIRAGKVTASAPS